MKINRKENFKFLKYIIFFGLLFFQFSLNVSAAGSSGGSNGTYTVSLVNASTLQEASAKIVMHDSFSLGYFQMGESTTLAKYRTIYEDTHGTNYSKNDFLKWISDNNLKLTSGTEILCYNDCVIFMDTANGAKVLKTGWLYEYCDTSRYMEWIDNRVAIGDPQHIDTHFDLF